MLPEGSRQNIKSIGRVLEAGGLWNPRGTPENITLLASFLL